jgi:hypothetical protein
MLRRGHFRKYNRLGEAWSARFVQLFRDTAVFFDKDRNIKTLNDGIIFKIKEPGNDSDSGLVFAVYCKLSGSAKPLSGIKGWAYD